MGVTVPDSDMEVSPMPGPAPKHPSRRARRNNPKADFRSLSADGRKGPAPKWPLQADVQQTATLELVRDKIIGLSVQLESADDGRTKGRLRRQLEQAQMTEATVALQIEQSKDSEVELWTEMWTTPQALMWDESSAFARMVAQFVRWNIRAEQGDLKAATEARLRGAELGLSPLSLMRLRREVQETQAAEDRGKRRTTATAEPAKADSVESAKGDDDPRGGLWAVS